jgi:hypothetical protein
MAYLPLAVPAGHVRSGVHKDDAARLSSETYYHGERVALNAGLLW